MRLPWRKRKPVVKLEVFPDLNDTVEISKLGVKPMTTSSPVASFFQGIFTAVKAGLAQAVIPPTLTFLQNTSGLNSLSLSDQLKYIAQLDLLRSSVMANLTSALPTELAAIDATISNELQTALQNALKLASPAPQSATAAAGAEAVAGAAA